MSDFKPINKKAASGKFICCDFCKGKKVKAKWQLKNPVHYRFNYACDKHKTLLKKPKEPEQEHITEADYQTWYNL